MSSPSSRMRPAEGLSTPVSRLITVVLPAPFGPIKAWRAPFSILSETPATAAMPPKCFSKPTVSSTTGMAQRPSGRSEEHTSELQSLRHIVCRLLLEKKKDKLGRRLREVEGRGAEEHRRAHRARLDQVLRAEGQKAAANERDVGRREVSRPLGHAVAE